MLSVRYGLWWTYVDISLVGWVDNWACSRAAFGCSIRFDHVDGKPMKNWVWSTHPVNGDITCWLVVQLVFRALDGWTPPTTKSRIKQKVGTHSARNQETWADVSKTPGKLHQQRFLHRKDVGIGLAATIPQGDGRTKKPESGIEVSMGIFRTRKSRYHMKPDFGIISPIALHSPHIGLMYMVPTSQ